MTQPSPDSPAKAAPPPPPPSLRTLPRATLLKLGLLLAVILSVLLGVLLTAENRFWREIVREQIDARLSSVTESRCNFVREWVGRQQDRVDVMATRRAIRNYLEKQAAGVPEEPQRTQSQENLDAHVSANAVVGAVAARILSREGAVLLSSDPAEVGRDLSGDLVFRAGLERTVIGVPRLVDGRFLVEVAAPSRWIDATRGTIGVVLLTLDATSLVEALRSTTGLGQTGEVQLGVREAGQIRFLFPPRYQDDSLTFPLADAPLMAAAIEGRDFLKLTRDYRGQPVLAAGRPIGFGGWGLVAKMDEAEVYAPIARALHYGLWIGAIIALGGLAAAFGLARYGLAVGERAAAARLGRGLGKVKHVCALAVMLTGLVVLAGWALKIELLTTLLPGLVSMKPNTALGFILAGLALALRHRSGFRLGCAAAIIVLGGLSLAQDFSGADFGTDQLLFRVAPGAVQTPHPGRMSPVTAVNFVLLGGALLLLGTARPALRRTMEALVLLAGLAALFALVGYAYGSQALYQLVGFSSMALHTALAFALLAAGILSARADGLAGMLTSTGLGGQVARRFLPLAIIVPPVLGWLVLLGGEAGHFSPQQATVVFGTSMVLVMAVLVWWNALALGASDAERTHAEESQHVSEAHMRLATEATEVGIWEWNVLTNEIRWDAQMFRLYGVAPTPGGLVPYSTWSGAVLPEDLLEQEAVLQDTLRRCGRSKREFHILRRDDRECRHIQSVEMIRKNAQGQAEWVVGTNLDITDARAVEAALRKGEERLRLAMDGAQMGTWHWDLRTGGLDWSERCLKIFGIPPRTAMSYEKFLGALHPEDRARTDAAMQRALQDGADYRIEFRNVWPDGSMHWATSLGRAYYDAAGVPTRMEGIALDITERKQAEEALRESEERLRLAMDAAQMGSWDWDMLTGEILWTPHHEILFGYAPGTPRRTYADFQNRLHPDDAERVAAQVQECIGQRTDFQCEFRVVWADGSSHWISGFGRFHYDAAGRPLRMLGMVEDISARKQAEQALRAEVAERQQAEEQVRLLNRDLEQRVADRVEELATKARLLAEQNAEIERARLALEEKAAELALTSRYKSEFLANMSHELRTPLNSILILSQQLAENKAANLTAKQVEFSRHIHSSGQDLLNLISDILDHSKIESGTVSVAAEEIAFDDLCKNIDRDFRHVAEAKGLPFHVSFARDLPPSMESDPQRLQQILKNLLSNAMKFTAHGKVEVRVDIATQGWSPDHPVLSQAAQVVAFAVEDSGIGIAPDKQRLIFEAFQQADAGTARSYGGTGLGLAISRELARLLGGEIRLASAEGEGSTFSLYLPLHYAGPVGARAAPPEARPPAALRVPHKESIIKAVEKPDGIPSHRPPDEALRGRKILVVDDDARNIFALVSLLESQEMEVLAATNGRAAIEILRQTPDIALVLMDIMMPGMDGYETMREIRQLPAHRNLPILALTAKVIKGDREKCLDAGASDCIAKPVNTDQLLSLMRVSLVR